MKRNPPLLISFEVMRGDYFAGPLLRFKSALGVGFWGGAVLKSQLRTSSASTSVVHTFDLSGAVITNENGVGVLSVPLFATKLYTINWPASKLVGDLNIESSSLPKTTLAFFRFNVSQNITAP